MICVMRPLNCCANWKEAFMLRLYQAAAAANCLRNSNPGSLIWKNGRHEKVDTLHSSADHLQATAQDRLWQAANIAYEQGFYKNADSLYTILLNDHGPSAEVYYNLGNACYKQEDWPRAILNYERCLQIDRRHKDAIFNLELSNTHLRDRIDPIEPSLLHLFWRDLCHLLPSGTWGWITLFSPGLRWDFYCCYYSVKPVAPQDRIVWHVLCSSPHHPAAGHHLCSALSGRRGTVCHHHAAESHPEK